MTIKGKHHWKKQGEKTFAEQLKEKPAKDISPLEMLAFKICSWRPVNQKTATVYSNTELASMRTKAFLENVTVSLMARQIFWNYKNKIKNVFRKKAAPASDAK